MSSGYEGVLQHKGIKPELVGKLGKCGHMYHLLCLVAMYNNGNKVGKSLWARRRCDVTLGSNSKPAMCYSPTGLHGAGRWSAFNVVVHRWGSCMVFSDQSYRAWQHSRIVINSAHFSSVYSRDVQMYCLLMQKRQMQADLMSSQKGRITPTARIMFSPSLVVGSSLVDRFYFSRFWNIHL